MCGYDQQKARLDFYEFLEKTVPMPDVTKFFSARTFEELYYALQDENDRWVGASNNTFYICTFFIKKETSYNYEVVEGLIEEKDIAAFDFAYDNYCRAAKECMSLFIKESLPPYKSIEDNFRYINRIGSDIGICIQHRSRKNHKEDIEERELDQQIDYDEPDCIICRDGGCPHCEPYRFIR